MAAAAVCASTEEQAAAVDRSLAEVFSGLPDGSQAPDPDSVKAAESMGHGGPAQFIYGEVGDVGPVLAKLSLRPSDTFYDLGSGRGRLVLGAAMMPDGPTTCARAVGIELDANRHAIAEQAAERVGPTLRPCDLRCGDVLVEPKEDATVVFCNNAVFGPQLNALLPGVLTPPLAPKLRAAYTTHPLPLKETLAADLLLKSISVMPVNWAASGHPLYCYARGPPNGEVDVDPKTEAMIDAMRACCFSEGGSGDHLCLMRVAAFAHQVRGEAEAWRNACKERGPAGE